MYEKLVIKVKVRPGVAEKIQAAIERELAKELGEDRARWVLRWNRLRNTARLGLWALGWAVVGAVALITAIVVFLG